MKLVNSILTVFLTFRTILSTIANPENCPCYGYLLEDAPSLDLSSLYGNDGCQSVYLRGAREELITFYRNDGDVKKGYRLELASFADTSPGDSTMWERGRDFEGCRIARLGEVDSMHQAKLGSVDQYAACADLVVEICKHYE